MPVGIYVGKEKTFTNHEIQLEIGDTFYIFSDGYPDQTGKEGKKTCQFDGQRTTG